MAEEKSVTQKFMEGFGLDYPEDLQKFSEVFCKFTDENKSLNQLFKSLIEAFPEKRDAIMSVPIYVDDEDGKSMRVTLDLED